MDAYQYRQNEVYGILLSSVTAMKNRNEASPSVDSGMQCPPEPTEGDALKMARWRQIDSMDFPACGNETDQWLATPSAGVLHYGVGEMNSGVHAAIQVP